MGGATAAAASLSGLHSAFGAEMTTALYVKGLIILSFEDPTALRLGFPKAAGHKATFSLVPLSGTSRVMNLKGTYKVGIRSTITARPDYKIPEMIRMQEFYGNKIRSTVEECPTLISIPYAAIRSITTAEVSSSRYTFVRADNGQEITTFRPRKVAETIKIELSSDAVMKLNREKTVAMNTMKEVHAEYSPEDPESLAGMDAFTAHFPHYNAYMVRPPEANFDVLPKNLAAPLNPIPKVGNNFLRWPPYVACFVVAV
jgi:hypothetical protein